MGQFSRSRLARIALADESQAGTSRSPRLLLPEVEEFRESADGNKDFLDTSPRMKEAVLSLIQELVKGQIAGLGAAHGPETAYLRRVKIGIKTKGKVLLIDPADVASVEAQGNYALMRRQSDSYLLRASISTLAEQLEPHGFLRVHRSSLINASWVEEIRSWAMGEYIVVLKGGREYIASRTYRSNLKRLANTWIGVDFPNRHGNV
jgi:DNA-binding LytR/AlgR family response regulator